MLGPVCLPSQGDIVCQVPIQYSEIIGRESPLHSLQQPHTMLLGQIYRLLASHAPIWSVVQSVTSARSWEELLALHLGSDVGEEEEKGCCTSTSCRQPCTVNGDPFGGSWHPLCLAQVGNPAEGRLLCCPTPPPPCLRAAARLSFTCLFSSLAFHYPASSYLCPLLKADLFISESLSVLCPSFHLLANLFYLLSA